MSDAIAPLGRRPLRPARRRTPGTGHRGRAALYVCRLEQPTQRSEVDQVNPLLLGYQIASPKEVLRAGERAVARFAQVEGYTPGPMYVEPDSKGGHSALASLLDAARRQSAAAVAVPTAADLGRTPRLQQLMAEKIRQEAGVMVFVVEEFTL